ncbi:MAG: hypothetical protein FJ267_03785 [Planctomycetes bacterium]|nr:hypothetical protein [Planctomycetota bacterium]
MDVAAILDRADDSVRDYACYVLLDFATVDREQSDAGIAASLIHSKAWGIYDRFAELVQKELGLAKKAWSRISKDPEALVDQAAQVHTKVMSE